MTKYTFTFHAIGYDAPIPSHPDIIAESEGLKCSDIIRQTPVFEEFIGMFETGQGQLHPTVKTVRFKQK